ncbi:hypothetical protein QBC47DRAFT_382070 [Echria macrotheca]|uniref:Fungal N-terminal domain-containing protein n=1 Tax=Echria macrotheca TaxID=438768 RepID=A0AAJ0FB34_9PEZI|nr:hypothetical protein QBC47DRAFT_382070 [Echria macrotheca]
MDPISTLGAAAGGIQLVDFAARAFVGSLKLVRELRDAPARVEALLADVERSTSRILHISDVLLKPGATFFDNLSADHFARLSSCSLQVRRAMDDLRQLLASLCESGKASSSSVQRKMAVRRLWRAVVTVQKQDEVANMLEKVDRLNLELIRELEVVGLEMQAASSQTSAAILAAVHESQHATAVRLDQADETDRRTQEELGHALQKLESLVDIGSEIRGMAKQSAVQSAEIAEIVTDTVAGVSLANEGIRDVRHDIKDQFTVLRTETQSQNRSAEASAREIRADIAALSNTIAAVLANSNNVSAPQMLQQVSELEAEDRARMGYLVSRKLVRYPNALQAAYDNTRRAHVGFRQCKCSPSSSLQQSRRWRRLEFSYASESDHRPTCPRYKFGTRSWSYMLKVQLFPVINKTVELVAGTTAGAGCWSIAPPLRFRGVVRRSDSPIFRLFDELPLQCAKAVESNRIFSVKNIWNNGKPKSVSLLWESEKTSKFLDHAIHMIEEAVVRGQASGADVDEYGNTLLFEVFNLAVSFCDQWQQFSSQLRSLLFLALDTGSDTWSRVEISSARPLTYLYKCILYGSLNLRVTALEFALSGPSSSEDLKVFFLEESNSMGILSTVLDASFMDYSFPRRSFLRAFMKKPEIAGELGYGDLAIAILRRSLSDVERLAVSLPDVGWECGPNAQLTLLELALGWSEGLAYLSSLDLCPADAFFTAVDRQDIVSLRVLLRSTLPLFSPLHGCCRRVSSSRMTRHALWCFWAVCYHQEQFPPPGGPIPDELRVQMFQEVAREFRWRCQALNALAISVLSDQEKTAFALSPNTILDAKAPAVYDALASRVSVPAWLQCCGTTSVYGAPPYLETRHLDILYQAGFRVVDTPDGSGLTPLLHCVSRLRLGNGVMGRVPEPLSVRVSWFLQHGANPIFTIGECAKTWPTVLFYVTADLSEEALRLSVDSSVKRSLNRASDLTDGCKCFCSVEGCIAPFMFWRCRFGAYHAWKEPGVASCRCRHLTRNRMLQRYSVLCNLGDMQMGRTLQALCRLEIFERMGMAHTCCSITREGEWETGFERQYIQQRVTRPDEDRLALQEEDSELASQLDMFMAEYASASAAYDGPVRELWNLWWRVVDMILPPLTWLEACCHKRTGAISDRRDKRERNALVRAGYDPDNAFPTIIQAHFDKYRGVFSGSPWPEQPKAPMETNAGDSQCGGYFLSEDFDESSGLDDEEPNSFWESDHDFSGDEEDDVVGWVSSAPHHHIFHPGPSSFFHLLYL